MSTSFPYPGRPTVAVSPAAKASSAAAVVALATAVAGTGLVAGLVAGSAVEAPSPHDGPAVVVTIPEPVTPPITGTNLEDSPRGGGDLGPLHID
ncbi:MAG: hypothetical protein WAL25_01285 [Acidimicrobiia bacterium]